MIKLLCGSSKLFKDMPNFKPNDTDYIVITDSDKVYEHTHPSDNICYFIWGKDKELVRKYITEYPEYLFAMSLVTKEFVEHYDLSWDDIEKGIGNYYSIYKNSSYAYYIPLFDYLLEKHSWDFPLNVIEESYKIYQVKKHKKKVE